MWRTPVKTRTSKGARAGDRPFLRLPRDLWKRLDVLETLTTFRLMKQTVGGGSWVGLIETVAPDWAKRHLTGGKRQREAMAAAVIVGIAVHEVRKLGARLMHTKKRGGE